MVRSRSSRALCLLLVGACGPRRAPDPAAADVQVFHPPPPDPSDAPPPATVEGGPAWDAVGQTSLPARVAVFSVDEPFARDVAERLGGLQGVADTYVVPGYLVDGRSGYVPAYSLPYRPPAPVDLQQLREVAAMAACDVLLVVDHGYRQRSRANAWAVFTPLLVPMLVVPFLRVEDHAYVDAHLVDVRDGHLYGQVRAEDTDERGPVTLYALENPREDQLEALLNELRAQVSDLLWHHLLEPR